MELQAKEDINPQRWRGRGVFVGEKVTCAGKNNC